MIGGDKTNELIYICNAEDKGNKLLDILINKMELSSRLIRRSKKLKAIFVNNRNGLSVNMSVRINDEIKILLELEENQFEAQKMNIPILYEDLDMLVVDKEPFKVVHPTKGHQINTIANGLAYIFNERGINTKIRFINRLDRDTSGLLLIAKNSYAQQVISNQMRSNKVVKKYIALVHGIVENKSATIDLPIGRISQDNIKRCVINGGKNSITHYDVIETFKEYTLVKIVLETGRTHQIRVHFSHIGHPIVGDELYGGDSSNFSRQALHGAEIIFEKVRTKERVHIISELPSDIKNLISELKR